MIEPALRKKVGKHPFSKLFARHQATKMAMGAVGNFAGSAIAKVAGGRLPPAAGVGLAVGGALGGIALGARANARSTAHLKKEMGIKGSNIGAVAHVFDFPLPAPMLLAGRYHSQRIAQARKKGKR